MAQTLDFENDVTQTVDFSVVSNGDIFIYNNSPCVKLDNNNPNYTIIGTGSTGKLNNTDQVVIPNRAFLEVS